MKGLCSFFPDLVPKENLEKWLDCLKKEFPTVAFKSSTLTTDRTMVRVLQALKGDTVIHLSSKKKERTNPISQFTFFFLQVFDGYLFTVT